MKAATALLVCLLACARPLRDPHEGQLALKFHNATGSAVCAIHIFRSGENEPGANWLPPETEVPAGRSLEFWLVPDTYQFQVRGCPYERLLASGYAPSVIMNIAGNVVLYNEADATSKAEAQRLAHANENTTLIPAKLERVASPTPRPANQRTATLPSNQR